MGQMKIKDIVSSEIDRFITSWANWQLLISVSDCISGTQDHWIFSYTSASCDGRSHWYASQTSRL